MPNAFVDVSGVGDVLAQLRDDTRVRHTVRDRLPQDVHCAGGIAALPLDECEVTIRERHVGTPLDHLPVELHRLRNTARGERFDRAMQRGVQVDQPLGSSSSPYCAFGAVPPDT